MFSGDRLVLPFSEARNAYIGHTLVGYEIRTCERFWVVIDKIAVNEEGDPCEDPNDPSGQPHTIYWCGDYWAFEWDEHMLMYTYRAAVMVADGVGGKACNFADILRYDRWRCGYPGSKPPKRKASREALGIMEDGTLTDQSPYV